MAWSCSGMVLVFTLLLSLVASRALEPDHRQSSPFILEEPFRVVRTDVGEIRVFKPEVGHFFPNFMLSLVQMKSSSLLLPQYLSAKSVFYINKGNATLTWIAEGKEGDNEVRLNMQVGDAYAIPEGTVFYFLNTQEDDLEILWLIEAADGPIEAFFIGGGSNPTTLFSGFDLDVLAAALKLSREVVATILSTQSKGPIVTIVNSSAAEFEAVDLPLPLPEPDSWNWRNLLPINKHKKHKKDKKEKKEKSPQAYSLFEEKAVENEYGWARFGQGKKFLKEINVGLFGVHLEAGAMVVPHWNPHSVEIGVVTNGTGSVHISFPNGTTALNRSVKAGSVFLVPRFFPSIQVADTYCTFDFVGFTISLLPVGKHEHSHVLAGGNSVLKALDARVLAASFGVPESILRTFLDSQEGTYIVPTLLPLHNDSYGYASI